MLLCLECYKVYNQKTIKNNMCKVKDCYGDVVEVDELFVPVIAELNRKGYRTRYCCSSHYTNDSIQSYIMFEDFIEFPSLPKGYNYDVSWTERNGNTHIESYLDKNKSFNELNPWYSENYSSTLSYILFYSTLQLQVQIIHQLLLHLHSTLSPSIVIVYVISLHSTTSIL